MKYKAWMLALLFLPSIASAHVFDWVKFELPSGMEFWAIQVAQAAPITLPPVMERIANCESGNRQFDENRNVLRGKINKKDIGKFQISETYWLEIANQLEYNIYEEKGNTLMALYIYEKYGTKPWKWSAKCWQMP